MSQTCLKIGDFYFDLKVKLAFKLKKVYLNLTKIEQFPILGSNLICLLSA